MPFLVFEFSKLVLLLCHFLLYTFILGIYYSFLLLDRINNQLFWIFERLLKLCQLHIDSFSFSLVGLSGRVVLFLLEFLLVSERKHTEEYAKTG